ncbi:hypothetical protein SAMN05216267_101717 [Actinacidiphila rubida]|uniref:Lipoprotein n=1 Tax=Actinacidiphila rubida TaxID=310780 RepID=A0A1H8LV21_9ACTN|nr:hypothetical protein SAMN05216267_101717 [Actinacidiphila rubida]
MRRRTVLLAAAAAAAAGCSGGGGTSASPTQRPAGGSAAPPTHQSAAGSATTPALPAPVTWQPGPGEIEPAAKLAAVRLVEAFGTWPDGQGGAADRAARAEKLGIPAARATALAGQTGNLTPAADAAVVHVIDAQYGGILSDSASVLVVCSQITRTGTTLGSGGTTVDVRLSRTSSGWSVTSLHPAQPGPAAPLDTLQREVLANPRISLPPASAADIRSGRVHASVLNAMQKLAGPYRISVSVVRSGHPLDVFGTNRPSDHPQGRAFDVWRIDGHPVVDPATSRALITGFMRAAAAAGSYNVGGPVQLSGGATANQFFSDATHHDHVHVGFTG